MSKECIFYKQTGFQHCSAEWLGEGAMQICCAGQAKDITLLELMSIITNNTRIHDITQLVNFDAFEGEDPRIVKLLNVLRDRGVPIRIVDDNYLSDKEFKQVRRFNIRNL